MSDEDLIGEAIRAANSDEAVADEAPVEDTAIEPEMTEEQARTFAGKFNSVEDLESAYEELQRKFHESRQPEPEFLEEDDEDVAGMPQFFGGEPQSESDLVSLAEQDPTNAALWVMSNTNRVPEDLANAVLEHWWTQKPWEATQFWMEQRIQQEREQLSEMTFPLVEQHERAVMGEAYEMITQQIPDYDEYQDRVEEFIEQHDVSGLIPDGADSDPVALAEGIGTIVGILKWREYQQAMQNQGMIVPDQEPQVPPKVSTGNTTVASEMGDADIEEAIRNMILNA